jgi:hypothetical protein
MHLPRIVVLGASVAATLALSLPAAAQPDHVPDRADREPGNPVAHCLPDKGGEDEESPVAPDDPDTEETGVDDGSTMPTIAVDEPDTDETGVDDEERGAVAQCVLDSLPDIVGNPHASSIVALVVHGIAHGKADGTYGPHDAVTRGQMATFLSRALDLEPSQDAELPDDVDADHPHADGIAAVIEEGIAKGKSDGSYGAGEAVSRGQMAAFLDRALGLAPQADVEIPADARGSVHEKAIEAVMGNGIAQGFTDGTFRPGADVSRGQMASFLARGLDL